MKFNFSSFLLFATISTTGAHAATSSSSLRGKRSSPQSSSSGQQQDVSNKNNRVLLSSSSAQVLDLEEFIKQRVSGDIGGDRLLPSDSSTFESLDYQTLRVQLMEESDARCDSEDEYRDCGSFQIDPFLDKLSPPTIKYQATVMNRGNVWSQEVIDMNGSFDREVSVSVTSGIKFNKKEFTASVRFPLWLELPLSTTVPTTETGKQEDTFSFSLSLPPNVKVQATEYASYVVTDPTRFSVDIEIIGGTEDANENPALCYYYRDAQNTRNYMCNNLWEIFLPNEGQPSYDHSFAKNGLVDTIRYQVEGTLSGVNIVHPDTWVELDYECLPNFVYDPNFDGPGGCIPESEVDEDALAVTEEGTTPYYHKERLIFDEDGGVQKLILDDDGNVVQVQTSDVSTSGGEVQTYDDIMTTGGGDGGEIGLETEGKAQISNGDDFEPSFLCPCAGPPCCHVFFCCTGSRESCRGC